MNDEIAIIIGRKIIDNIDREIVLQKLLMAENIPSCFLIPGNKISYSSLSLEDIKKFESTNFQYFNSMDDFQKIVKSYNLFLIASWRDYVPLVSYLKSKNKKVIVYNDAGGNDFWDMGANILLFKSIASVLTYQSNHRNFIKNFYNKYFRKKIITGSIRYEYSNNIYKKTLVNEKKKIIVFFPKCFSNIRSKLPYWFPFKTAEWYDNYIIKLKVRYKEIFNCIKKNPKLSFYVKLHYSIFDLKFSMKDDLSDINFWTNIGAKILQADEREIFERLDLGIGVESHSAIDVNYHKKPFIYVTPFLGSKPNHHGLNISKHLNFKKVEAIGFDNFCGDNINVNDCWLPFWYGALTDLNRLDECIEIVLNTKNDLNDLKRVQNFYWGHSEEYKSSEKIVEFIKGCIK